MTLVDGICSIAGACAVQGVMPFYSELIARLNLYGMSTKLCGAVSTSKDRHTLMISLGRGVLSGLGLNACQYSMRIERVLVLALHCK